MAHCLVEPHRVHACFSFSLSLTPASLLSLIRQSADMRTACGEVLTRLKLLSCFFPFSVLSAWGWTPLGLWFSAVNYPPSKKQQKQQKTPKKQWAHTCMLDVQNKNAEFVVCRIQTYTHSFSILLTKPWMCTKTTEQYVCYLCVHLTFAPASVT